MKDVKSKTGEIERQPREYAPDGPVRLAPSRPDTRGRKNGDGSKNESEPERPVYASEPEWSLKINADGSREVRVEHGGKVIHECKHAPPVSG